MNKNLLHFGVDLYKARFALSDINEWGYPEDLFNFDDFHNIILDLLDSEDPWTKDLLKFYNEYVFSLSNLSDSPFAVSSS